MNGAPSAPSFDAVIFDFFGTLADLEGFTFDVAMSTMAETLAMRGVQVSVEDLGIAYRREIVAYLEARERTGDEQHNTEWLARVLTDLGHSAKAGDPTVVAAVDAYFEQYLSCVRPLPGVLDTLARLAQRLPLGLLSNFTDPRPVRGFLERHDLVDSFASIVVSAEIGRCKPQPDVFRHALAELGVAAERALFVGDDPVDDVKGASAVGMQTAWIRRGPVPALLRWAGGDPEPETAEADHVIEELAEVLEIVG